VAKRPKGFICDKNFDVSIVIIPDIAPTIEKKREK